MKEKIIEILMSETFNTSDEAGNTYMVVEIDDFNNIAERIVKLFAIPDVISQRELLIAFQDWYDEANRWEMITTKAEDADAYLKAINSL